MSKSKQGDEKKTRIAIVAEEKCKPKKCSQECKKYCPVVKVGKLCITVKPTDAISRISEELCIGCGICINKCPFDAISIINLPKNLESRTVHRFSANSHKLHGLPVPRAGQVLGIVGINGIGKSTALKILGNKLKPNLGRFDNVPDWQDIIQYFRGSELQNYLTKLLKNDIKAIIKPQYVDAIPKMVEGTVKEILSRKDERKVYDSILKECELGHLLDKPIKNLSGGELQRFAIAIAAIQSANVYMFDEPSSYLDVKQRLQAALTIRALLNDKTYVIVVEHDLSVLDYLSDFVCCIYGTPGAYGVVTMPYSVREGINVFLDGYIPTDNMRFRDEALTFKVSENFSKDERQHRKGKQYPSMSKTLIAKKDSVDEDGNPRVAESKFHLDIDEGDFNESEIIVLLGQNGTGKTTFIRMLAGLEKSNGDSDTVPPLSVSYKPQKIAPSFAGTVRELLNAKIAPAMHNSQFQSDVVKPMKIDAIIDQKVKTLSGGELQRTALVLSLGIPADIYLIDEPSAYLDSEQRLIAARVIKRFIMHAKKTAFIVEHDFIMSTYLADRVIVYEGQPGVQAKANTPQGLVTGMNKFLTLLNITFRRDPVNHRPRINKLNSQKDQEQKKMGNYFFIDTEADEAELEKADKAASKKASEKATKEKPTKGGKK